MSIKERKERERDERRELILDAASEIIAAEGIGGLSVRKIANKIEYSPSIIYHYFQDKDDIIHHLMKKSYQGILDALTSAQTSSQEPEQKMKEMARKYIDLALHMPDEYLAIMLSSSPAILAHTSVLFRGASSKRPAIGMLCQCLQEIYTQKDADWIECTAQVIWASLFGLIIRLIIEKDMDESQKQRLIEHHIEFVTDKIIG